MTVVNMPGRHGRSRNGGARIDTRNCYLTDEAAKELKRTQKRRERQAMAWWAFVSILAVASLLGGVVLGSRL